MRLLYITLILVVLANLSGCVNSRLNANKLPKGAVLNKSITLPVDVGIAYYLPKQHVDFRFILESRNLWVEPGAALQDAARDAFGAYFSNAKLLDRQSSERYGLLIDLEPKWDIDGGKVSMTLKYKVFNGGDKSLLDGTKSFSAPLGYVGDNSDMYNAAMRATQLVIVDVLNSLKPSTTAFPTTLAMKDVNPLSIANLTEPVSSGTGFYINESGRVLTAAHVMDECLVTRVQANGQSLDADVVAKSTLLDLAVVETGNTATRFLPLREGSELFLGESVTSVSYPLQGLLAASPNLTRGNVSSLNALKGAMGQFQFSAPIQPGSSGGPVVSDGGELLGVTVATLNAAKLIESGALPQNVNFALDAKHVAKFLDTNQIKYTKVEPNLKGDMRISNNAAMSSVVQLACFQ